MADKNGKALDAYDKDPLGVLNGGPTTENPDAPWIEHAICHALSLGGWNVEPGDGCGIVANMIRDAVAAETERCSKICDDSRGKWGGYGGKMRERVSAADLLAAAMRGADG